MLWFIFQNYNFPLEKLIDQMCNLMINKLLYQSKGFKCEPRLKPDACNLKNLALDSEGAINNYNQH